MKSNRILLKSLMLGLSSVIGLNLHAQLKVGGWWVPGSTAGTGAFTKISAYTDSAFGVGVSNPLGKAEILYCPPFNTDHPGLVVTKKNCYASVISAFPLDGLFTDVIGIGPIGGNNEPSYLPSPVSPLHHYTSFTPLNFNLGVLNNSQSPLIWGRVQTPVNTGGLDPGDDTRFIVFPDGRTGVNVASPRCAMDVRGFGPNKPVAIFGVNAQRAPFVVPGNPIQQRYTKHVEIVPHLAKFGYNRISQEKDLGIFFTDGLGNLGTNVDGALVIAPWSDTNSVGRNIGGLRMDKLGNVELRGDLRTTNVIVDTKWWPDYVFEKGYELRPLDSISVYIERNGHLPDMPSQDSIVSSGQNLGSLQRLQQQKIEELTLYMIQLKKEVEALRKELEEAKR